MPPSPLPDTVHRPPSPEAPRRTGGRGSSGKRRSRSVLRSSLHHARASKQLSAHAASAWVRLQDEGLPRDPGRVCAFSVAGAQFGVEFVFLSFVDPREPFLP